MLKVLACLTMLIDHIGYTFFPGALWLRIIGRLAFPIFAWYVAVGFRRTHNRGRYLARLLGWGLLSQIPFALLFHKASLSNPMSFLEGTNVLFTFVFAVLGLLLISACEKLQWESRVASWAGAALFAAAAQWANTDYGAYGVVIVLLFYLLGTHAAPVAPGVSSGTRDPALSAGVSSGTRDPALSAGASSGTRDPALSVGASSGNRAPVAPAVNPYADAARLREVTIIRQIALPLSVFLVTLLSLKLMRMHPVQLFCVLAVPLTYLRIPDPKPGKWKHAFYAFYPVHIFLIWLVTLV